MQKLKNWDNKTWLSSSKYLNNFYRFLKLKLKINNETKVLDIGCGRANIISFLQKKYKFKNKAIGIDIIKNKEIKKNIVFNKIDALKYLKKNKKFDLILIKQTIHFFSKNKLIRLLGLIKNSLNSKGLLLIFSLKIKNNEIPCFKKMQEKLDKSLKRDQILLNIIKKNLKNTKETYFDFNVNISKRKYVSMIEKRYISCLLDCSGKELDHGIDEIKSKYKDQIKFTDTLKCISFRK